MLTQLVVEELVAHQRCGLTPFDRSVAIHLSIHDVVMAAYRELTADPLRLELSFT
jgi:hypothetical protein